MSIYQITIGEYARQMRDAILTFPPGFSIAPGSIPIRASGSDPRSITTDVRSLMKYDRPRRYRRYTRNLLYLRYGLATSSQYFQSSPTPRNRIAPATFNEFNGSVPTE